VAGAEPRPGALGHWAPTWGEQWPARIVLAARRRSQPNSFWPGPINGPAPRLEATSSSAPDPVFASSLFSFSHPPQPPGSSPCCSVHWRGWEEFCPAGSGAGPRAGLGLPKLGLRTRLSRARGNLRRRAVQVGRFICGLLWFSFLWFSFLWV
jgi:hypothetical protein